MIETRLYKGTEVRAKVDSRGIEGFTAVFDSLSVDLGGFREIIEPGAFASSLTRSDPVALFNHDPNFVLGRLGAGTLSLDERDEGLWYEVGDVPQTREDVLEAVRRGDVIGNSFAFYVRSDRWEKKDGEHIRFIEEFERIFDVGPVVYPAYPETTVSARAARHLIDVGVLRNDELTPAGGFRVAWGGRVGTDLGPPTEGEWAALAEARRRALDLAEAEGR